MRLRFKDFTVNIVAVLDANHSDPNHQGWHTKEGEDHVIMLCPHTAYADDGQIEATLLHELVHMAIAHAGIQLNGQLEEQICEALEVLTPLFFDRLAELVDSVIKEPTEDVR